MIKIWKSFDNFFVWTAEEAYSLRKDHRFLSPLVGCLPQNPLQNNFLSLPLLLSTYEARLALEKGFAVLYDENGPQSDTAVAQAINFKRKESYESQVEIGKVDKLKQYENKIGKIMEGKRKKIRQKIKKEIEALKNLSNENINSIITSKTIEDTDLNKTEATELNTTEEIHVKDTETTETILDKTDITSIDIEVEKRLKQEVEKEKKSIMNSNLPYDSSCLQIHTARFPEEDEGQFTSTWPLNFDTQDEIKFRVFSYFWNLGFYVTSGLKFGGDFLVYPGDASRYHSWFIVKCEDRRSTKKFSKLDVVRMGRMATNVKKTYVMACVDLEGGGVECISIKWKGV